MLDRQLEAQTTYTEFRNRERENPETAFDPGAVVTSISATGSNLTVSPTGGGAYTVSISSTPNFTSVSIGGNPLGTVVFANQAANVVDTATSPGAAYVQAEAVAVFDEMRAIKNALIAANIMA